MTLIEKGPCTKQWYFSKVRAVAAFVRIPLFLWIPKLLRSQFCEKRRLWRIQWFPGHSEGHIFLASHWRLDSPPVSESVSHALTHSHRKSHFYRTGILVMYFYTSRESFLGLFQPCCSGFGICLVPVQGLVQRNRVSFGNVQSHMCHDQAFYIFSSH